MSGLTRKKQRGFVMNMIYVLPGMGADNRMYAGSWRKLPDCVFLDWPAYAGETSLAAVARRVVDEAGIGDDAVVVGTSLGGMVACEIAKIRRVRQLVLVASAVRKEEVSRVLAALRPLAGLLPGGWVKVVTGNLLKSLAGGLREAERDVVREAVRMYVESDPCFVRAMCRAIFRWEGFDVQAARESGVTVLRLHGKRDRVLLPSGDVDAWLEGGHLITMTHARECIEFLWRLYGPAEEGWTGGGKGVS
ncbi:hypothetical protein OPIT5_17540 [Opitutaceae bacterium TAV5]|nr:hypothetical protein OPIT5_17540 [Opitutaceae bacterium TAV5]